MGFAQYDASRVNMLDTERKLFFANLGVDVSNATSLETALNVSGMNFTVEKRPLQFVNKMEQEWNGQKVLVDVPFLIKDQYATVRTDKNEFLGIVGKNYEILQNIQAFDFLDSLVGEAKFETAGLYGPNSAKSFVTMSTEPMEILGDEFKPYLLFLNAHDGSSAVRVMFCTVRVFCSNCLGRAIKEASNKISLRHSSNLQGRLEQAKYILTANTAYGDALKKEAEKLAVTKFSQNQFEQLARELFPINTEDKQFVQVRNEAQLEHLLACYRASDLDNFKDSMWRVVQCLSDFESHMPAFRQTETLQFKNMNNIVRGMPMLNNVLEMAMARVA